MAKGLTAARGKWTIAALLFAAVTVNGCASSNQTATSFNVFFVAGSAALSADAEATLTQAADAIRRQRPGQVTIAAGVDTQANIQVAEPRYLAVQQGLVTRGIEASLMARASLPQIEANAGSTAVQRVEIILSPNP